MNTRLILRAIQLPTTTTTATATATELRPTISPLLSSARIRIRRNSKIANLRPTAPDKNQPLPSQSILLPPSSESNPKSSPELVSSFQEPLVGLSPPLVQQDNSQANTSSSSSSSSSPPPPPKPPKPPKSNPSTSLTTSSNSPNEYTVLPTHAFHTHRFVKQLERSTLRSESAKEILKFVESSLRSSEKRWLLTGPSGGIVSKSYAEGQAYLYNAALGELRTEVQVKARNDGIVLKSASNSVQREIDNLKQKLKEDISALKNELQLEFNHRKEEASDDQKKLELSIQELNSKFTILVSEVRTEIETRKWVTTRRCVVAIASLALCVVIFTALENPQTLTSSNSSRSTNSQNRTPSSSSSSSSSLSHSSNLADDDRKLLLKDQIMRSVEELGILPEREDTETEYNSSSNSFFGSSSFPGKRIGE
ncbi:hypothetical protein PGT21_008342 [Puccinia graminis f. sp. tritici]|uniref:Uncharacterized protein n=1 Tax=Puccinia graminis f. sp. tritici TaxID=56615 RepID=A0A5B0QMQ5_PUCGR|nr:hypothetical protein PGT21_008342 [Puccinia graminis f. sp. tritici]KAA1124291.1 hypothetical protein PGTUg99_023301 [Puccinia graminis f. sp. tritici]